MSLGAREVREEQVERRLADGERDADVPVVRDDPVVPGLQRVGRADLERLVAFAGNGERALAHAVEHALALADGAGQEHLVVEIEELVAAQPRRARIFPSR